MIRLSLICCVVLLLTTACEDSAQPAAQTQEAPIVIGQQSMPKQLVTVVLTSTPDESSMSPTPVPTDPPPTNFPELLDPTRTPTPFVGVFVGASGEDGTPSSAAVVPQSPVTGFTTGSTGAILPTAAIDPNGCSIPVASRFDVVYTANSTITSQLGCAVDTGADINLVFQSFERGSMFWRDTRQIYALQPNNSLGVFADSWNESLPADDPAFVPPANGLSQPIRGFGFVWRNNETLRNAIGWATGNETPIPAYWQTFTSGAMFVGNSGSVYIILNSGTYYGPF